MKRIIAAGSSLVMLLMPLWAGTRPPGTEKVLEEQRLKTAIQCDRRVLKNLDSLGEPLRYVQVRQEQARKDLVRSENALTALRTAPAISPVDLQKIRIVRLERAVQRDKASIDRPGQGAVQQTLALLSLRSRAQKDLARHEARLRTLKTTSSA
jgi:hypothetical protein